MNDSPRVTTISNAIATIASIAAPPPDQDIYQAGFASTDALSLLIELEDQFGVTIPDDRFIEARTPAALAALVAELRQETA